MPAIAAHTDVTGRAPAPRAPATIEDTGLGAEKIAQLCVKHLYGGEATGLMLADRLHLPYALLEAIIERARGEKLVEVRGSFGAGTAGFRFALREVGRDRASQYL